jgi:hypothetical protein
MTDSPASSLGNILKSTIEHPSRKPKSFCIRSGKLKPGQGTVTSVIALSLGFLCLLAVLAFHFPQYLTTPDLRHQAIRSMCSDSCCSLRC